MVSASPSVPDKPQEGASPQSQSPAPDWSSTADPLLPSSPRASTPNSPSPLAQPEQKTAAEPWWKAVPDSPRTGVPPPRPTPADQPKQTAPLPQPSLAQAKTTAPAPQRAGLTAQEMTVFVLGFLLAAVALAGAWMTWGPGWSYLPAKQATEASAPPATLASGQLTTCPLQPAAAPAGENDGKFPLQADVSGLTAADIASFLVVGKTAAANGRSRDAEIAFLMACRVADNLKGADSVESADAKFQLGGHYAQLALAAGSAGAANRPELLRRAELLYADSLQAYRARYSEGHEKSRSAAEGLAAVQPQPGSPSPSPPATAAAATAKPPSPALSQTDDTPSPNPSPAANAEVKPRQDPSVLKDCPEAVAALGFCNPAR
ncbi:MAG: hypothetical protein JWR68_2805 [Polaromonas sp.]|nr:hypothetical protein [Polaromonas sp.]